ncbi:MAG: acetate--CoA ligase family protein [Thermodesulfobacteriota bacterium]|nr:acetate--CoA ligase family protein [Thermodesulfobacteriota bacterium]
MNILEEAIKKGQSTLSEYQSKKFLASHGIPITKESMVSTKDDAIQAAKEIGFPVVLKGCGSEMTHKTEHNMIELDVRDNTSLGEAYDRIMSHNEVPLEGILVQEMIKGERELVVGLSHDPQFGPCVMFGLGGIFTEILNDVSFRIAPLEKKDAMEMVREIRGHKILDAFRGKPAVNLDVLAQMLITIGTIGLEYEQVKEIDINPLIISGDNPVAVDALVVLNV